MKNLVVCIFIILGFVSFSQSKKKLRSSIAVLEISLRERNDSIDKLQNKINGIEKINSSLIRNQEILVDSLHVLKSENTILAKKLKNTIDSVNREIPNGVNNTKKVTKKTTTTTFQNDDPFSTGGEGGGRGGKFVPDNGNNDGKGNSDPKTRIRLNDPNFDNIEVERVIRVNLQMTIDENGQIVTARSTSKTTTTDQRIINRVISEVKRQVRYNKDPDTSPVMVYLTVGLEPK
jgi:hypothetical protein